MYKLALIAAIMAVALPAPALAADWMLVAESINGHKFYIDRQSIRTMPNGLKRAWQKTEYNTPDKFGDTAYKGYEEFDCFEKRKRNLSALFYKGEQITTSVNKLDEWIYVSPDSNIQAVLNFVCRK